MSTSVPRMSQIVASRLAARNDGLEKIPVILFNEWNEVRITTQGNYEQLLTRVSTRIVVFQNVQQTTLSNRDDDFLE